jgi:hypothetical protein
MEIRNRIHPEELNAALEQVLREHFGARRRIKRWRRRLSVYSSSYTIENLELELNSGKQLRLVLKDLSPASLLSTAQRVRPHFLYDPLREIETYRITLDPIRHGTAVCYGAVVSNELERYWLFLERVPGPLLWQKGRIESWEMAARWLAGLHEGFATAVDSQDAGRVMHLKRYDGRFFGMWLTRAEEFLRHKNALGGPETWRRFGRLADRYDRVIEALGNLPTTFIHGEFYPSNVILREAGDGRPICPVDWELAAVAPGLIDLAALTSGDWSPEHRLAMVAAYRERLSPSKGWPPSMAEMTEALDLCRLHLSIQLLGWASEWSPPKRHARNWLHEAFRLADKLGL